MCFGSKSKPPPPPPPAPVVQAAPVRADEANRKAVDEELELLRRRQGLAATNLTGGLGDAAFGSSVGAAATAGGGTRTTLGGI